MPMAWFEKVARGIDAGASEATLTEWRNHMQTTPATLRKANDLGTITWMPGQVREDIEATKTLARTVVQRIYEVMQNKVEYRCSAVRYLQEMYRKNLRLASTSEPVSNTFLDMASAIWDRALSKPKIAQVILAEENKRGNSLFNSTTTMHMRLMTTIKPATSRTIH